MCKKLFGILLLIMFSCSGCGKKQADLEKISDLDVIKNRGEVIIGVREDTKPFGYRDNDGNFKGFEIDLAREIARYILGDGEKVKFVAVTANDRIEKLNSKEVDMLVATMTITSQRLRVMDFSDTYYKAGQALMVRAKSDITSLSQAVVYGKLITVFGTTAEKSVRDIYPMAKIIGVRTYKDALEALKSGKGDAIIADDTVLIGLAEDKSVKLFPKRYSVEPYGVGLRQTAEAADLKNIIKELIERLDNTGKLKQMFSQK